MGGLCTHTLKNIVNKGKHVFGGKPCKCLQWSRFFVTVFSEVRFSITGIFIEELLEKEDIIRICIISHSSPIPLLQTCLLLGNSSETMRPISKTIICWHDGYVYLDNCVLHSFADWHQNKKSNSHILRMKVFEIHYALVNDPHASECLFTSLQHGSGLFLGFTGEGIRHTSFKSSSPYADECRNERCLNLKFMALHATLWSTLILFPVCCISRIELTSVYPGSLCQVT